MKFYSDSFACVTTQYQDYIHAEKSDLTQNGDFPII